MLKKMAGWNNCLSWPIHKTLFHMRRLVTIVSLAGCVWFAIILYLFLSIRVSLESCRSVCGNSSFVVPLVTWHLESDFSVHFTSHKELPTG